MEKKAQTFLTKKRSTKITKSSQSTSCDVIMDLNSGRELGFEERRSHPRFVGWCRGTCWAAWAAAWTNSEGSPRRLLLLKSVTWRILEFLRTTPPVWRWRHRSRARSDAWWRKIGAKTVEVQHFKKFILLLKKFAADFTFSARTWASTLSFRAHRSQLEQSRSFGTAGSVPKRRENLRTNWECYQLKGKLSKTEGKKKTKKRSDKGDLVQSIRYMQYTADGRSIIW